MLPFYKIWSIYWKIKFHPPCLFYISLQIWQEGDNQQAIFIYFSFAFLSWILLYFIEQLVIMPTLITKNVVQGQN